MAKKKQKKKKKVVEQIQRPKDFLDMIAPAANGPTSSVRTASCPTGWFRSRS